ncbi:hypothetical protein RCO28_20630 [Streptomyces sp. LHD-70]|uniref:hypothetical protein n=1 Tax=Streptomyces sp. LHD-70 TaxID=3072140 RepID=UPI00280FAD64|nr:hypothetical protein [Streptomyces sp. LHD-70]MDQ8704879.1 hypothetical protein [Streptomyces sp. LHD-70]
MAWTTEEFGKSHEGWTGAVLPDGTEPKKAYLDPGSGSNFYETHEWWAYRGGLNRPMAARVRAACSCGWRGEKEYSIDWDEVGTFVQDFPSPEPLVDWERHLDEVEALTIPLPDELTVLLEQVTEQLERLVQNSPLAAIKAVSALERATKRFGSQAAAYTEADELSDETVANALGLSAADARARLLCYRLTR